MIFVFFFLQAEDGIRDYKVTGVQTCALPICCPKLLLVRAATPHYDAGMKSLGKGLQVIGLVALPFACMRSEERRVGKECRSRMLSYIQKTKKNYANGISISKYNE